MTRCLVAAALVVLLSADLADAQERYNAQWIWYDAGEPANDAAVGSVWFRREVRASEPSTGGIRIICDDAFQLWVNGQKVGEGGGDELFRFNLNNIVDRGPNVIAIEAANRQGKAGLFVDGEVRGQSGRAIPFDSGPEWRATVERPEEDAWLHPGLDTSQWQAVKVIGPHEQSPWNSIVLAETYRDRYELAPGFEIERIAEPDMVGTLVAFTWGNRGRLIASRERGPIISLIDDDGDRKYDRAVEFSTEVQNCQGLCTVFDDLYAVGKGPQGVGLYRLPDENHDDVADRVEHVSPLKGSMGDHGPHDVIYGPDGWLYLNLGNHAWVTATPEPTTAVRGSYEGVLLQPRFEDARGHARGIRVPGGTIWRFTPDGENWWCETAGFRNEYDFAFNWRGDMFTFDSDMEWDVGMPWYRPVRVNHCIPGAEFGWRSGCAKWPPYYFDSLPGTVDIGRGSPTGVVFYEHRQFPESFRGAFIVCDWSMGRIIAVHLQPKGATFHGEWETIVNGNPLNVSDIEIDRDGSLVFSTGGRGTEGGVYRVSYTDGNSSIADGQTIEDALDLPQMQAAWAREIAGNIKLDFADDWEPKLVEAARSGLPPRKVRALTLLCQFGPKPETELLLELCRDEHATVRQFAAWLLGERNGEPVEAALTQLLSDEDLTVRRRACEAFVRSGIEPPAEPLIAAIASDDRWLRFAARLALERVPVEKWVRRVTASQNPHVVTHGLLALYRLDCDAVSGAEALRLEHALLSGNYGELSREQKLEVMRIVQLTLEDGGRDEIIGDVAVKLLREFPTGDRAVDYETARILAAVQMADAVAKIVDAMQSAPSQADAIHYALMLRYFEAGWSFNSKQFLLDWYESTREWEGGHSFQPYLANIVGATLERYHPDDRKELLLRWNSRPFASALMIRNSRPDQVEDFEQLVHTILEASIRSSDTARYDQVVSAAIEVLGRDGSERSQKILRDLYDAFPDRRDQLARMLAEHPNAENWPYLIRSLQFGEPTTLQLCVRGLRQTQDKRSAAEDIRAIILAALKLGPQQGKGAVRLLGELTSSRPEEADEFQARVAYYQNWYHEHYPQEPVAELPKAEIEKAKYTYAELYHFLEESPEGRNGDPQRGQKAFAEAKCVKCHRFNNEGETIGPDLTSLRRRFQRKEIIESMVYPSQVISDQYRMVSVVTVDGLVHNGMPIRGTEENDSLILLLSDATQIAIPKEEIDEIVPSKVSVMPVGTLKELTLEEIADLFAFLETSKFNQPTSRERAAQTEQPTGAAQGGQ